MMTIAYALASMTCAGVNDFVFKIYAERKVSIGAYLALIGVIWTLVFMILGYGNLSAITTPSALHWGLISGLFSALANIFLIVGMARMDVSTAATIYRLNLAPAAILAFLLLGESITAWKILGISVAALAVLLFCTPSKVNGRVSGGIWIVTAACLLRASMGIAYKYGLSSGADPYGLLALNGMVWIVCGVAYHLFFLRGRSAIASATWGYGAISGLLVCGIVLFMVMGLQVGDASIVLPVAQLSFVMTSILGALVLREALTHRKIACLGLALLCILLLTMGVE